MKVDIFLGILTSSMSVYMYTGTNVIRIKDRGKANKTPFECGRNLTLTCMFNKNTTHIAWKISNDRKHIAKCTDNNCLMNPAYNGQYDISIDMTRGIFNLTIIRVTMNKNGTKLVCSDGSHYDLYTIKDMGADIVLQQTGSTVDQNAYECGKNLTLTCMFTKKHFAIVWKNANDLNHITKCMQNECTLNPEYAEQYDISVDLNRCIYNLTIRKLTKQDNGRTLVCSDGSNTDYHIIRVRNYLPRLFEETNTLTLTSGCISSTTKVFFKWIKICEGSGIEKEISPSLLDNYTTSCSNDSECGYDNQTQYTEKVFATSNNAGNCNLRIVAVYENKQIKTYIPIIAKYTIEEQDNKEGKNSIVLTEYVNPAVVVGVVFLALFLTMIAVVTGYRVHVRRKEKSQKQTGHQGDENQMRFSKSDETLTYNDGIGIQAPEENIEENKPLLQDKESNEQKSPYLSTEILSRELVKAEEHLSAANLTDNVNQDMFKNDEDIPCNKLTASCLNDRQSSFGEICLHGNPDVLKNDGKKDLSNKGLSETVPDVLRNDQKGDQKEDLRTKPLTGFGPVKDQNVLIDVKKKSLSAKERTEIDHHKVSDVAEYDDEVQDFEEITISNHPDVLKFGCKEDLEITEKGSLNIQAVFRNDNEEDTPSHGSICA